MQPKLEDVPSPVDFHDPAQAADWVASVVERRPSRPRFFTGFVVALNAQFQRFFGLLELGSGPGHLAEQILLKCPVARYVALDFSEAMHALARERLKSFSYRTEFIQRDFRGAWGQDLPLFDAIVTMQAAHEVRHKAHLPAFLAKTRRQIARGGLLLFCDHFSEAGTSKNPNLLATREEQPVLLRDAGYVDVEELHVEGGIALYRAINPSVGRG
jgi:SAM-dependent methyltransferase